MQPEAQAARAIPADRRSIMGNVKLLSSVVEGSVKGSMQRLTY